MSEDWNEWHKRYKRNRPLQARFDVVCNQLAAALTACPPGEIRVLSVCSGDGRDLMTALIDHPRASDVRARLVDLEGALIESGKAVADLSGLGEQLEFLEADASAADVYLGAAPADIVIVCGVFGHVLFDDLSELIRSLTLICKTGGFVVWTRSSKAWNGESHLARIRSLFAENEFEEVTWQPAPVGASVIVTHRYTGTGGPLPAGGKLFVFTGSDFAETGDGA